MVMKGFNCHDLKSSVIKGINFQINKCNINLLQLGQIVEEKKGFSGKE